VIIELESLRGRSSSRILPRGRERAQAVLRGRMRARRLSEAGFDVRCDGMNLRKPESQWRPFSDLELAGSDSLVEQHLR
jgi:hypothetical protein